MGNTRAKRFEEIALPHLDAVHRMARRLSGGTSDAEDLVQETFARAFRAFDEFELREYGAKPWLLRILHNVFYTHAAKSRREPTLLDDVDFDRFADELDESAAGSGGPRDVAWDRFDQEIKWAVEGLSPEYRSVLLLWALEELSYKEIAHVCGCAIGTVMSRLYRARQLVGRALREYAEQRKLSTERFEP